MNPENKLFRFFRNTGPARFMLPLAIVLIIMGIMLTAFAPKDLVETTGTVTSFDILSSDESSDVYSISVAYTVEGKEYSAKFETSSSSAVGDSIKVYYNPSDPSDAYLSGDSSLFGIIMIVVGVVLIAASIYSIVRAFGKDKKLAEQQEAIRNDPVAMEKFAQRELRDDLTELYFRFDGNTFKPGYIIEDADRKMLYECKMLQNNLVEDRRYSFTDHVTMRTTEHKVSHTVTQSYNDEFFSKTSYFKIDGTIIWDLLHSRGIRITTDLTSKFPKSVYTVIQNGENIATIETSSKYVHEDDEAKHSVKIPVGRMYYRFWTRESDLENLFLVMFALSETEQAIAD